MKRSARKLLILLVLLGHHSISWCEEASRSQGNWNLMDFKDGHKISAVWFVDNVGCGLQLDFLDLASADPALRQVWLLKEDGTVIMPERSTPPMGISMVGQDVYHVQYYFPRRAQEQGLAVVWKFGKEFFVKPLPGREGKKKSASP